MKELKLFVAHFITSGQITEDQWVRINKTLVVTDATTVGEIKEWYAKQTSTDSLMDIHLTESPKQ